MKGALQDQDADAADSQPRSPSPGGSDAMDVDYSQGVRSVSPDEDVENDDQVSSLPEHVCAGRDPVRNSGARWRHSPN